jgi:hypothetical protein
MQRPDQTCNWKILKLAPPRNCNATSWPNLKSFQGTCLCCSDQKMRMHVTLQMCVLENRQDTHNLHQKNTAIDNFDRCKSQKTLQFISTVPGLKTA